MANTKPFSKELYAENNSIAIVVSHNYLISTGHYRSEQHPLDQPETFKNSDFSLIRTKDGGEVRVEVERKKSWKKSGEWEGFRTLDVPTRKRESKSDLFVMTNRNCDTIAVMKMKDVLESPTYEKDTIYTEKEEFFAVDLGKVKFISMRWEKV
jgi:hypothetical protein